ncbi:hypothetical protein, partial [Streptomyces sp. NPDC096153]|uniref:hypothetical protein n=1 Tax=Streptomyces sp. NPDC096153 TaxID=3155548 RepID=UPI0033287149
QRDVRGMQPRRRLVEQVERVPATGPLQLGGQFNRGLAEGEAEGEALQRLDGHDRGNRGAPLLVT